MNPRKNVALAWIANKTESVSFEVHVRYTSKNSYILLRISLSYKEKPHSSN
ncbi:hypothetical protein ALT721_660021 [Alteromonas alvinellae]